MCTLHDFLFLNISHPPVTSPRDIPVNYGLPTNDGSDRLKQCSAATTVVPHSFFEHELKTYTSYCISYPSSFFARNYHKLSRVLSAVCFKQLFMIFCWASHWRFGNRMDILFPQVEVHLVQRIAFKRTLSLVGSLGISIPDQVHNCNDEDFQEFPAIDFTSAPSRFPAIWQPLSYWYRKSVERKLSARKWWGCLFPHHSKTRDNNLNIYECLEPSHQTHQSLKRLESRLSLLNSHLYLSDWAKLFWIFLFTEKNAQQKTHAKKKHTHPFPQKSTNSRVLGTPETHVHAELFAMAAPETTAAPTATPAAAATTAAPATGVVKGLVLPGCMDFWLFGVLVFWCFWWFLKGFFGNCLFHCLAVFLSFLHWCHCSSIG